MNWIIDADIRGFFDNISHEWLMKFQLVDSPDTSLRLKTAGNPLAPTVSMVYEIDARVWLMYQGDREGSLPVPVARKPAGGE